MNKIISGFLEKEVAELEVKHEARYLITTPKEIAKHTGLSMKTVKTHLSEIAGRRTDGKVVIIRINRTDVIIKLVE